MSLPRLLQSQFSEPIKLSCPVQHYLWGKIGSSSLVGRLLGRADDLPYAELWMGAHKKAPSMLTIGEITLTLDEFIDANSQMVLGERACRAFGGQLPFLFKVLSIRTALSIQAHPNRIQAAKLQARSPEHYPDVNHKPEIAIALTPVSLLLGFRPLNEIKLFVKNVPELRVLLGEVGKAGSDIRQMFEQLLSVSQDKIELTSVALWNRLSKIPDSVLSPEEKFILRLRDEYPRGDVGLFAFYFLNYRTLLPMQAVYIAPGTAHCYLSGDLLECMANSDNVVRAGLTEKFKDVSALIEILDFSNKTADNQKHSFLEYRVFEPSGAKRFSVPNAEFYLDVYENITTVTRVDSTEESAKIVLCLQGSPILRSTEKELRLFPGDVYFLPANLSTCHLHTNQGHVVIAGIQI